MGIAPQGRLNREKGKPPSNNKIIMSFSTDNKAMKLVYSLLKKQLQELDKQLENSDPEFNTDDFKILLGKHALAEELIHKIQSTHS